MSKFIIELEDNGEGVMIRAHAIHTAEQMLSGQTTTVATQIGGSLTKILEQRMAMLGLGTVAESQTQH